MFPRPSRVAVAIVGALLARPAAAAPLSPDDVVAAALARDPDLVSAESDVEVARGARRQTKFFLNNPQVFVGVDLGGDRTEAQVTQPISLTGEGYYARRSAGFALEAREASARRQRLVTAADARLLYVEAVVARQREALARDALDVAGRLRSAVERQFEVGEASQLEARLARLAESDARQEFLGARSRAIESTVALAGLTGLDPAEVELAADPGVAVPASSAPEAGSDEARADVLAAGLDVDAARTALARQRAGVLPAVSIGAFYEAEVERTLAGPVIQVEVPLWSRNQAGLAAGRADLAVAEARQRWIVARAAAEQATAQALITDAASVTPAAGIDPAEDAGAALSSVQAGYAAGELDLQTALFMRAQILDGRAASVEAAGQIARARIAGMLAVGDEALLSGGAR